MSMWKRSAQSKPPRRRRKLVLICESLLFLLVAGQFIRVWFERTSVEGEISALKTEAETLQNKNVELRQLIGYLNSPAFVEEKARQDLGLQRPGEQVVIVAPPSGSTTERATPAKPDTDPNPVKWLRLITGVR